MYSSQKWSYLVAFGIEHISGITKKPFHGPYTIFEYCTNTRLSEI